VRVNKNMLITSPAFKNNDFIPRKFSCEGGDINPELHIANLPEETKGLALIMHDPDAPDPDNPRPEGFTHWLLWNIDPRTSVIKEESVPPGAVEGKNDAGKIGYMGPCPPPGKAHRYFFKLYALSGGLSLSTDVSRKNLEKEIEKHLLGKAELVGIYKR